MNSFLAAGTEITYYGKTYIVVKTNPKNFVVTRDGQRYNLPRTAKITVSDKPRAKPETAPLDFAKMVAGVVVKVKVRPEKFTYPEDQAFVVLKHNFDLVNIVALGGDSGRYWRVPLSSLEIVKAN